MNSEDLVLNCGLINCEGVGVSVVMESNRRLDWGFLQARIYREEGNVIDLYILLLRYSR